MSDAIRLVVQGDDFGMCHAVDEGIVRAYQEGILRQTTAMVPCPWFGEAAALAKDTGIPIAMHSTLTAEWDHLRWRSLTGGRSLRGEDGTFLRTVAEARSAATDDDAIAELLAQAELFVEAVGKSPIAFDCHMGLVNEAAYIEVCNAYDRKFIYPIPGVSMTWTSVKSLSDRQGDKRTWLLHYLEKLEPGTHFLCTHPGQGGDELASIHTPGMENYGWALDYRVTDLDALTATEVKEAVERLGIELCSVADLA